ncbi:Protein MEC-2 b [Aphelenchoides avenae]|nr:Protein MEC-2 b [Aphelenchus avenae]
MKDREKRVRKFQFHAPKSDPTSPATSTTTTGSMSMEPRPPPLDLSRVLNANPRNKLFGTATPPQTPTTLSADAATEALLKQRAGRTWSTGSAKQRFSTSLADDPTIKLSTASGGNGGGTSASGGNGGGNASSGILSVAPSPKASGILGSSSAQNSPRASKSSSAGPFAPPRSKFKMAHESFRIRMFQEQHGFEPVFMTKKRSADSKFSEFKGGDLNKYTARSYTIQNGNEIFGANIQNEFGICGWILTILSYILIICTLPISACFCIKVHLTCLESSCSDGYVQVVQEYERAVIFRLGRLMPGGAKGPGIFFIVPCIDTYRKVDLRVLSFEVPPQEILSKDSVTVAVDAVVYFRISNATISVTNVEDSSRSTKLLAQTTLRNILGTKTLAEMLSDREAISLQMQATLDEATEPWGVKVERVEMKDVRLPVQLQRAMAAEAEASREAKAKVIVAEGEQKASRALKEAAEVIAESPSALQLRYLQTLNSISAEKNSTIIFPFPIDLLSSFLHSAASTATQKPQKPAAPPGLKTHVA